MKECIGEKVWLPGVIKNVESDRGIYVADVKVGTTTGTNTVQVEFLDLFSYSPQEVYTEFQKVASAQIGYTDDEIQEIFHMDREEALMLSMNKLMSSIKSWKDSKSITVGDYVMYNNSEYLVVGIDYNSQVGIALCLGDGQSTIFTSIKNVTKTGKHTDIPWKPVEED